MNFTKTIINAIKHWSESKFNSIEMKLNNKQSIVPVTTEDNDKVMTVIDGAWGAKKNTAGIGAVKYDETQELNDNQKLQARENIGASAFSGNYNDLVNKPDLADVATSGDYNDLSNTPIFAAVAISGDYNDLTGKPNAVLYDKQELTDD